MAGTINRSAQSVITIFVNTPLGVCVLVPILLSGRYRPLISAATSRGSIEVCTGRFARLRAAAISAATSRGSIEAHVASEVRRAGHWCAREDTRYCSRRTRAARTSRATPRRRNTNSGHRASACLVMQRAAARRLAAVSIPGTLGATCRTRRRSYRPCGRPAREHDPARATLGLCPSQGTSLP